jgi:hypothetical protein
MRMQLEQHELRLAGESDRPGLGSGESEGRFPGIGDFGGWSEGGMVGRDPRAGLSLRLRFHFEQPGATWGMGLSHLTASGPFLAEKAAPTRNVVPAQCALPPVHTAGGSVQFFFGFC